MGHQWIILVRTLLNHFKVNNSDLVVIIESGEVVPVYLLGNI